MVRNRSFGARVSSLAACHPMLPFTVGDTVSAARSRSPNHSFRYRPPLPLHNDAGISVAIPRAWMVPVSTPLGWVFATAFIPYHSPVLLRNTVPNTPPNHLTFSTPPIHLPIVGTLSSGDIDLDEVEGDEQGGKNDEERRGWVD